MPWTWRTAPRDDWGEKRQKLVRQREARISWGKALSIILAAAFMVVDRHADKNTRETEFAAAQARLETRLAVTEARFDSLKAEVERQASYWAPPAPRTVR